MPVGLWVRSIAVSTLLTFCPPAPEALIVVISKSAAGISISVLSSSSSGITSTAAKLVCLAPLALKGDFRTSRCVPFSPIK